VRKVNVLRDLTVEFGSLVDEGANKGARVLLFKRDSAAETTETKRGVEMLMKDVIWAEIQKLAGGERERDPGLTPEGAVAAALKTREGLALAEKDRTVGHLTCEQFLVIEKRRSELRKFGWSSWADAVVDYAKRIGAKRREEEAPQRVAKGLPALSEATDLERGLPLVAKEYPAAWENYLNEENGY